jgi:hypothetical protein
MEVHKITTKEFLELTKNNNKITLHAWEIRNLFEEKVRLFIFGKGNKPSKKSLISDFKKYYSEALDENKSYLSIGLCYALLSKEGNYINGKPLYNINRNISSNSSYEELINL